MTLLRGYITMAVIRGVAAALSVLVSISVCIEFVAQLNLLGTGGYGFTAALAYVVLRVPGTVVDMLPASALIGSLFALGNLAVHRELTVMRTSGISAWQIGTGVGLAGVGLAVVMALLGESLAPSLGAYSLEMRTQALHQNLAVGEGQSTWLKAGDRILNLRRQAGDLGYGGGVLLFDLAPGHVLKSIAHADSADIDEANQWTLSNYAETSFNDDGVDTRSVRESHQTYGLSPDVLALSVVRQDLLDTPSLKRYIRYLEDNELDARRYLIAYWRRLANVVSVVLMTMLGLPFAFGSLRSAGTGARLLVGLVIGLAYYAIAEMLASGGEVFAVDPLVVAWAPVAALGAAAFIALARVR